jgi:hypothetical protein
MPSSLLLDAPVVAGERLHIDRTDIRFYNLRPDCIRLEILVRNEGDAPSQPTSAFVSAAPFGAFVPWRPLMALPVPALEAGQSFVLRTYISRVRAAALGGPDRVPPRRLLTALGAADERPDRGDRSAAGWRRVFQALFKRPTEKGVTADAAPLPADLFDLLGRGNPHWAGNLNIFVRGRAVERHLAQALRIYPGRTNMALFVLGGGRDEYTFQLAGEGADWDARLFDSTDQSSLVLSAPDDGAIREKKWIAVSGQRMMMLALFPPPGCAAGAVEVHVEQRSTGKTAVVEFSLDPNAAGPGCFVV